MHWKASKRILHYVQGIREFRIHYSTGAQLDLVGFTDSEWDGDNTYKKSTLGFLFMVESGPVFQSSKKQLQLALSSAKAEFHKDVNVVIQEVLLHGILTKFSIHTSPLVEILRDNQSAIKISSDLVQKKKRKHIEFHMHYIEELVHNMTITLYYCLIEEQVANFFTKYFTERIFLYLTSLLGVKD